MNIGAFVKSLADQGIFLFVKDHKLGFKLTAKQFPDEIKQQIKAHKAQIIAFFEAHQQSQNVFADAPPIVASQYNGPVVLSFAQQRLWFIDRLEGQSSQYNMPISQILEHCQRDAFQQALDTLVARHEVLRTTYRQMEGAGVQVVQKPAPVAIDYHDLSHLEAAEAQHKALEMAAIDAKKPFNISKDLMLRVGLLQLSQTSYMVIFNMHHIATDGWSMNILKQEFTQLYQAYVNGQPNPLKPLALQYRDYAVWQRQWLQGDVLTAQQDHWSEQLKGIPLLHHLPLDKPRPAIQTVAGATYRSKAPLATLQGLQQLCAKQGATLFMGFQAAFSTLLSRYSHETDIVVGTQVANRQHSELAPLIGFFVNTLILRSDFSDQPSFAQVLSRAKETLLGAYAHQQLPFERLVELLQPNRSLSHTPLFQITLSLEENSPVSPPPSSAQGKAQQQKDQHSMAKFDLTLNAAQTPAGFEFGWVYNTALFEIDSIRRMADSFTLLLKGLVAQPDIPVQHVAMVSDADIAQIGRFNATSKDHPTEGCFHQMFETQAAKTPEATALVYQQQSLSYRALNQRANQVAHYLIERGVKPNTLVGLYVERSLETLVGVLAILKAGGAYVPLDTNYPPQRLTYMVNDARLTLMLTQKHLLEASMNETSAWVHQPILLDDLSWQQSHPGNNPELQASPEQLAYVIYTSGSTGQPKGVEVRHRNMVNLAFVLHDVIAEQGLEGAYRWGWNAPLVFDSSIKAITQIAFGVELHLFSNEVRANPQLLLDNTLSADIELLDCTPSVLELLLISAEARKQRLPNLIIGGEAIDQKLWDDIVVHNETFGRFALNVYGPTECTVNATCSKIEANQAPNIGQPLLNMQTLVLDDNLQPLPIGVPGELFIGGAGVARGYLNQPQLSAKAFISHPFIADQRLYRSGDLVRWLADGKIDFIGRVDDQVKIRGFRIELGEVQNQLHAHPSVQDAVVTVHGEVGDKILVAYVVAHQPPAAEPEQALLIEKLSAKLRQQLPDYMVPAAFVILTTIPLTANGKIDKQALPAPDFQTQQTYVAPTTQTEKQLTPIWQKLLKLEQVSIKANFFSLGGHSLLITLLINEIAKQLHKELNLRDLFEYSTIETLAAYLDSMSNGVAQSIEKAAVDQPLLLSFAQQRLWFIDQLEGQSSQYNIPMNMMLQSDVDIEVLQQTLDALVERHQILRTTYQQPQGEAVQVIQPFSPVVINYQDLSHLAEHEAQQRAAQIVSLDAQKPFDLGQDLMLRAAVVKLSSQQNMLIFNIHHIATDGWSMAILRQEFTQLYQAFLQGLANPLPALKLQYADYAQWQRNGLQGHVLTGYQDYWLKQLDGIPQLHHLPLDKIRPPQQSFAAACITTAVGENTSKLLQQRCQQQGATLFIGLYAAFSALLSRYSDENDIVIGTPVANREHSDLAPLIGFFVNTLVLRSDLTGEPGFDTLLERCKATALGAYAHQQLPFEKLVELLQPERTPSHTPLFQVMLALIDSTDIDSSDNQSADVVNQPLSQSDVAKYDLTLNVIQSNSGLSFSWEYCTALFNHQSIIDMADNFIRLLDGMVAAPSQPVHSISMISEQQQAAVESERCNDKSYSDQLNVCQLISRQANIAPQRMALVCQQQQLTYAQLEHRANQVAHYLVASGVRPNDIVGLCVERSVHMMIGLLAILKAGAVYVPLDPKYPPQRLQYMSVDSGASFVLYSEQMTKRDSFAQCQPLYFGEHLSAHPKTEINLVSNAQDSAYIIYTSGSTGQPKGVVVSHGAIAVHVQAMQDIYALTSQDKVLQFASMAVDTALEQNFSAWLAGASLHISDEQVWSDQQFFEYVQRHQISVADIPPSYMQMLINNQSNSVDFWQHNPLRLIIMGGESFPVSVVRYWADNHYFEQCQLINAYGPTEATITASIQVLSAQDAKRNAIPIGKAVYGRRLYVLNEALQPLPTGVVGELFIGGTGLAKGYLNQPQLTAQAFVDSPFIQGERIYRTGDLVRRLVSGNIEFLGRKDEQVNIRGFRVELGEIEHELSAHRLVQDAVVLAHEHQNHRALVAYVVAKGDEQTIIDTLRRDLALLLPDYMVPSIFMVLAALPISPGGKVAKKELPVPDFQQQHDHVAPHTLVQQQVAQIWQDALGIEHISIKANFFAAGGHSILAVKLINEINNQFDSHFTVRQLFEYPTIELLAAAIDNFKYQRNDKSHSLVKLTQGAGRQNVICIPGMGMTISSFAALAQRIDPDISLLAIDLIDAQSDSIKNLVASYLDCIVTDSPAEPITLMGHSFGGSIAFELGLALEARGLKVQLIWLDSYLFDDDFCYDSNEPNELAVQKQLLKNDKNNALAVQMLRTYKLQQQMYSEYKPTGLFKGPVSLLYADSGQLKTKLTVTLERIQKYCATDILSQSIKGDHFTLLEQPYVSSLANIVAQIVTLNPCKIKTGVS